MKIACLADIHGNIHALEPILEQIENTNYDVLICCGDMVGYGAFPNEVVEFLRAERFQMLMGNCEQALLLRGHSPNGPGELGSLEQRSLGWTLRELTPENREFVSKVPTRIELNGDCGVNVLACHGSPESLTEGLYEDTRVERFRELAAKQKAEVVACGHTHVGFQKEVEAVTFVNCGSVGRSGDGDPRACYASIEVDRDANGLHVEVLLRRVKYDFETAAKAIVRKGLPQQFADCLKEGR